MLKDDNYWMKYSIYLMEKSKNSELSVGVVLVSEQNELICSSYTGEEKGKSLYTVLLEKIYAQNAYDAQCIYLTTNTLSKEHDFDLNEILNKIRVNKIFIGLPDPNLDSYIDDDPMLSYDHSYRYPLDMQREILQYNYDLYKNSKQCIENSPYYSENRISNMVIDKMKSYGIDLSKEDLVNNKQKSALSSLIAERYGKSEFESRLIVDNVISEAFNSKYGTYNYDDDTRSFESEWKNKFMYAYSISNSLPMNRQKILNVGVGSGNEAFELFSGYKDVTFVDVSKTGLMKIKDRIPLAKTVVTSADDLRTIYDESYDVYISLRTYNSSFFDINRSIAEAYRVLKSGAKIIISVANGFLSKRQNCIIPGLIIPGTEFVDIYRGMDMANVVYKSMIVGGFKDIKILPSNTEIYLIANKSSNKNQEKNFYPTYALYKN